MKDSFFLLLFLAVSIFWGFSCQNSTEPKEVTDTSSPFYVDDADHLFFKNTRAYYYDQSMGPGQDNSQRMHLYQLKKFSNTKDRAILFPVIVDNWIKDEAYLFVETNAYQEGYAYPLSVFAITGQDSLYFQLERKDIPGQLAFARNISKKLKEGHNLYIRTATDRFDPLLSDPSDQLNFQTTVKDYERLIQK